MAVCFSPTQFGSVQGFKSKSACLVRYSQIFHQSYDIGTASSMVVSTMQGRFTYLAEGPEGLVNSCDRLLKLDDGTRLPAHSPVLARFSPVFAGMLDEGPLSGGSAKSKVDVPLSGCSLDEAMLYSADPNKHLIASPFATVKVAHKYGMQVIYCVSHQILYMSFLVIMGEPLTILPLRIECVYCHIWQGIVNTCDDVLSEAAGIKSGEEAFLKECQDY